ncbi:MAG: TetR/AcrR family transcriptional regulator [Gaiellaceae bacterium]
MSVSRASARTGRRPGSTQTREAIAQAARTAFAELGYDQASVRAIARAAGVDPSLVLHFYGSKDGLFREVMALPPAIADAIGAVGEGPRDQVGARLAGLIVGALESPASRPIVLGRIRSAVSHPDAADLVRETVTRDLRRLADAIGTDRPDVRAVLAGIQVTGFALARYIVRVEPLASMPAPDAEALLAAQFQAALVGPLP